MNNQIQKNIAEDPKFQILFKGFESADMLFYSHRSTLLNFISIMILGATLLIVQPKIVAEPTRNTMIMFYFISIMLIMLSKYLFMVSFRHARAECLNNITKNINQFYSANSNQSMEDDSQHNTKTTDKKIFKQSRDTENTAVLCGVLSMACFLIGTLVGFFVVLAFWQFLVSFLVSICVFLYCYYHEHLQAQDCKQN